MKFTGEKVVIEVECDEIGNEYYKIYSGEGTILDTPPRNLDSGMYLYEDDLDEAISDNLIDDSWTIKEDWREENGIPKSKEAYLEGE